MIVHIKAEDIAEDVDIRFENSNFELDRPLPKVKNKQLIGLMNNWLGGQIMKEFDGLKAKRFTYLKENNNKDEKAKATKMCVTKRKYKFQDYKNCLEAVQIEYKIRNLEVNKTDVDTIKEDEKEFIKNNKLILKTHQRFRSENHSVFTEDINKIALSSNDDKRMQSIGLIEIYAHRKI